MDLSVLENVLDFFLAASLVVLAWTLLTSRVLFRSIVLFIVFGMLMALVWLRLGAPDIALAEAAIGTGLTAALMLEAVRQLENPKSREISERGEDAESRGSHGR